MQERAGGAACFATGPSGAIALPLRAVPLSEEDDSRCVDGPAVAELGQVQTSRTDGTAAGAAVLRNVVGDGLAERSAMVFFRASDAATGSELWGSDGTPQGTHLFLDLSDSARTVDSDAYLVTTHRDEVVLVVDDGVSGKQLWLIDGTAAGTRAMSSFGFFRATTSASGGEP